MLVVKAIVLVAFAVYCWSTVREVERLRAELEARVGLLVALGGLESQLEAPGAGPPPQEVRRELFAMRHRVERSASDLEATGGMPSAARASIRTAVEESDRWVLDGEESARTDAIARIDAAVGALRRANAETSEALGGHWDALTWLAVVAILFGFLAMLLIALLRVLHRRLASARSALSERLARTENDFLRVIESSPFGIVVETDGLIQFVNPAFEETLGYAATDLTGRRLSEYVAEPRSPREAMLGLGEHRFSKRDGSVAHIELIEGPKLEYSGRPSRLMVARDVSEQRAIEAQLRLADRLAAVGTVAAGMAHEINNPLTYVLANANVLSSQLAAIEGREAELAPLVELAEDIRQGAERVRDVVRGLRFLARSNDEESRAVDVRPVLESSLAIAAADLAHHATVTVDLDASLPRVVANEARFGQVVLNLLVNAAHAMEGRTGNVTLSARRDGPWVKISVADQGVGIPAALLDRVFEPFFTTKPAGRGTGLGLAICRRIVTSLGGRMELASIADVGTTVSVWLPAVEGDARTEHVVADDEPPTPPPSARGRILIVDDEEKVGASLARMLRGHHVETATSGAQALEILESQDFDVVICDLMMPGIGGEQVYDALKEEGRGREARLMLVTGGAFTERARAFIEAAGVKVLEKPFDPGAIRAAVEERLRETAPVGGSRAETT
ncbi:MAG: ATP-binding protein [Sandaracinaceae bacterium]